MVLLFVYRKFRAKLEYLEMPTVLFYDPSIRRIFHAGFFKGIEKVPMIWMTNGTIKHAWIVNTDRYKIAMANQSIVDSIIVTTPHNLVFIIARMFSKALISSDGTMEGEADAKKWIDAIPGADHINPPAGKHPDTYVLLLEASDQPADSEWVKKLMANPLVEKPETLSRRMQTSWMRFTGKGDKTGPVVLLVDANHSMVYYGGHEISIDESFGAINIPGKEPRSVMSIKTDICTIAIPVSRSGLIEDPALPRVIMVPCSDIVTPDKSKELSEIETSEGMITLREPVDGKLLRVAMPDEAMIAPILS